MKSIWYPSLGMVYVKRHGVPTTMEAVKELVEEPAAGIHLSGQLPSHRQRHPAGVDFLCCTAETQTNGRGTRGSAWRSPIGNLHVTVAVRGSLVRNCALSDGVRLFPALTSLCTLGATKQSLRRFMHANASPWGTLERNACLAKVKLKWPNDVLYEKKKIAGVLIEQFGDWFLIGVGVNVLKSPRVLDGGRVATSFLRIGNLGALGGAVDMESIRRGFVKDFVRRLRGFVKFPDERNVFRLETHANPSDILRIYESSLANDIVYNERNGKARYIPLGVDAGGALIARELETNTIRTFSSTYLH